MSTSRVSTTATSDAHAVTCADAQLIRHRHPQKATRRAPIVATDTKWTRFRGMRKEGGLRRTYTTTHARQQARTGGEKLQIEMEIEKSGKREEIGWDREVYRTEMRKIPS
eukprot:290016-Pleurochrysis_carterae.AAC.15